MLRIDEVSESACRTGHLPHDPSGLGPGDKEPSVQGVPLGAMFYLGGKETSTWMNKLNADAGVCGEEGK